MSEKFAWPVIRYSAALVASCNAATNSLRVRSWNTVANAASSSCPVVPVEIRSQMVAVAFYWCRAWRSSLVGSRLRTSARPSRDGRRCRSSRRVPTRPKQSDVRALRSAIALTKQLHRLPHVHIEHVMRRRIDYGGVSDDPDPRPLPRLSGRTGSKARSGGALERRPKNPVQRHVSSRPRQILLCRRKRPSATVLTLGTLRCHPIQRPN